MPHPDPFIIVLVVLMIFGVLCSLAFKHKKHLKYDAVLWDLDGTILDTQTHVHAAAECSVLSGYGVVVKPEDISAQFAGIPTAKVFSELAPGQDSQKLLDLKWEKVRHIIESSTINPIAGMSDLLSHLRRRKKPVPMMIASASPKWYIETLLETSMDGVMIDGKLMFRHTSLDYYFDDRFISADEVPNPKPAPDVFLEAAKRLGVDPKRCLVIGDGKSDVRAGTAAGMDVLFLGEADDEIKGLSNVTSFTEGAELASFVIKQIDWF